MNKEQEYWLDPVTKEEQELNRYIKGRIGVGFRVKIINRGWRGWILQKIQLWAKRHGLDLRE